METKINFGESLNEILTDRNIKVKDFAKSVNISLATVYSWLSNSTEPALSSVIAIADYFKCSVEFLIGRSDDDKVIECKSYPPLTKRIKVTGSGKVSRHHAYVSHLAPHKTHKQKRHLRKETTVSSADMKRIKYLIQQ